MSPKRVTRRQMLQSGSLLALPGVWHGARPAAAGVASAASTGLRVGSRMYESIGVRPIVNGRGTYTILSGSLMLPEVRAAMAEAGARGAIIAPTELMATRHVQTLEALWAAAGLACVLLTGRRRLRSPWTG